DLAGHRVSSGVSQHDEADQFITVIRPDHVFSGEIARKLTLDGLKILAVVPKSPALADGRLVEDIGHPVNEVVVIASLADLEAAFLPLANEGPRARFDLLVPPVVEALYGEGGDRFPLHVEVEPWFDVGKSLPEAKDIRSSRRIPQ